MQDPDPPQSRLGFRVSIEISYEALQMLYRTLIVLVTLIEVVSPLIR
jgi:hypothetical protein